MIGETLMYVIYQSPEEYPGKFVVREWRTQPVLDLTQDPPVIEPEALPESDPVLIASTVEDARLGVPPGMVNIGKRTDDDPTILEVWAAGPVGLDIPGEPMLSPRPVTSVEPDSQDGGNGYLVRFGCGHVVWFAVPVEVGELRFCGVCADARLQELLAEGRVANE